MNGGIVLKLFSSDSMKLLERSLSYSSLKQRTIANNIANVDTPNYKAKDVSFHSQLQSELEGSFKAKRTDPRHIPFGSSETANFHVYSKQNTSYKHNGNNVDIDLEMAEMAKNQIYYNVLVERMSSKFNGLKEALKGGQ